MDHAHGPTLGDGAKDRQRDQVVAAGGERNGAGRFHLGVEALDARQSVHEVDRVDRGIAEIGDAGELIGRNPTHMVHLAQEARHVADFARPVTGAGAVRGAAVPGHADEGDVDLGRVGHVRQAHEGGDRAEPRRDGGIDRLGMGDGVAHGRTSFAGCPQSRPIDAFDKYEISKYWFRISEGNCHP